MDKIKTKVTAKKAVDLINLEAGNYFATVTIWETEGGYSTEWWISSKFDWQLQLVGSITFPVWGDTVADVSKRVEFLRNVVFEFLFNNIHMNGKLPVQPQKDMKYEIAKRHIEFHMLSFPFSGKSERISAAFSLAEQFGVKETAVLISEVLDMNVRTVHDWVYRMRQTKESR
jgi:hypothetical protein